MICNQCAMKSQLAQARDRGYAASARRYCRERTMPENGHQMRLLAMSPRKLGAPHEAWTAGASRLTLSRKGMHTAMHSTKVATANQNAADAMRPNV